MSDSAYEAPRIISLGSAHELTRQSATKLGDDADLLTPSLNILGTIGTFS